MSSVTVRRHSLPWVLAYSVPAFILALVALFSGGTSEWVPVMIVLAALSISILSLYLITIRLSMVMVRSDDMTVREYGFSLTSELFNRLDKRVPFIRTLRRRNADMLTDVVRRTGESHDIERTASMTMRAVVVLFPVTVAAGFALAIMYDPLFLVMIIAPGIIYMSPNISLRLKVQERKSRTEEEVAYFLCYINIMQTVGHDLYYAFSNLQTEIFPAMTNDAKSLVKRVRVLGMTKSEALAEYAKTHPFAKFGQFVEGYLAKVTSIGGTPEYTGNKAQYFFEEYKGTWKRYEKSAQEMFSGIMMVAIILPMMIMLTAMIGSTEIIGTLMLMGTAISPLISIAMISMLNSNQPATGTPLPLPMTGIIIGAIAGVVAFVAGMGPAISIGAACLSGAMANTVLTKREVKTIRTIEKMLPEFMRDVTEISKTGANINQIITQQARKQAYKKAFNDIITKMAADIRIGLPLSEAILNARVNSMNFKFVMFLLERTYKTGGGTTVIFSTITDFITSISQTREQVTKSLTSLTLIVYLAPFLVLGISHGLLGIMSGGEIEGFEIPEGTAFSGTGNLAEDEKFFQGMELMTALMSIPMGLVAAKISSYTIRDLMPLAISSASTILAIKTVPIIIEMAGVF